MLLALPTTHGWTRVIIIGMTMEEKPTYEQLEKQILDLKRQAEQRKLAEEALRRNEARYRSLFENNPVETITVDYEARVTGYNLARREKGDRLPDIGDVMYKDYASKHEIDMYKELMECMTSGISKEFPEQKYRDRYLYINMSPFHGGAILTSRDMTAIKLAEKALRKNEAHYRSLFENNPVETITVDHEARVTGYNLARQKVDGRLPGIGDVMYKEYASKHERNMHGELLECIRSGVSKEFPELKYKDRYLFINMAPYEGGAIITSRDITFRTLAEKAIRESEEKYRTIFECTGTAMITGDDNTMILMANSEFETLSGYTRPEIEGKKSWQEFVAKEDLAQIKEYHRLRRTNADAAPRTHEFRFIDKHGTHKHVFATVGLIPGTKIGVSSFLDITHRKQAEKEREKLIEELREALSTVNQLSGMLPICSSCKKIRDDKGYWNQIEAYIRDHSEAEFSHGICPACARKLYPEIMEKD